MTWNSWHMGGIERKAIAQGFSFYSPIRYSELPRYYRESPDPLDVAVFQVTPMDEHGYFNFGPSASHLGAVCEKAKEDHRGGQHEHAPLPRAAWRTASTSPRSPASWRATTRPSARWPLPVLPTEVDLKVANLDRSADPQRCLPAAGHRRYAQRHRQPHRPERFEGPGRPHRDVCGRLSWTSPRPARSPAHASSWTRAVRSTPSVPAPRRCTTTSTTTPSACLLPSITPTISAASPHWTTSSPSTMRWTSTCSAR